MSPSLFVNRKFYTQPPRAPQHSSTMAHRPKLNAHLEHALTDPERKVVSRVYRSAEPAIAPPPPITGNMKVTVCTTPDTLRTWTLSKALLAHHSTLFATLIQQNPSKNEHTLPTIPLRDFQNYVDYMHSSIYSPATQFPGYRAIHVNVLACLLGDHLGAPAYSAAALRRLHTIFEPLARLPARSARRSSIRASDVALVCAHAGRASGLRRLFFDAVASHWTQRDAFHVGAQDAATDSTTWTDVYTTDAGFRAAIAESLGIPDAWRGDILRPVDEYLTREPERSGVKTGERDMRMDGVASRPRVRGRLIARPGRARLNRRESGERRLRAVEASVRELAREMDVDGQSVDEQQSVDESAEDEGWTKVDAPAAREA